MLLVATDLNALEQSPPRRTVNRIRFRGQADHVLRCRHNGVRRRLCASELGSLIDNTSKPAALKAAEANGQMSTAASVVR